MPPVLSRLSIRRRRSLSWALLLLVSLASGASAQGRPGEGPSGDESYRIGPEDVLSIQVWGKPELTGTAVVDLAGLVRLALLGELKVGGRTPTELSRDLTARYQLLDPGVSEVLVSVEEYHSQSVSVVGEVRHGGIFGFRELPDLWGALLMAGGPTAKAEMGRVQVIREQPTEGEPRVMTVDLSAGIDGTPVEALPELRPKDTIMVPSSEEVASGSDTFHVLGAVGAPGPYRLSLAKNLVEAISAAGGYDNDADLKHVYLTRRSGLNIQSFEINLKDYLYEGAPLSPFELQAGDTITIPRSTSFWRILATVLGFTLPFASLAVTLAIAGN